MRVRRANEHADKRAGELDIGHKTPAAGEKAPVLDAAQRGADTLLVQQAILPPRYCVVLLHLLAHQIEPLERRLVHHHEQIGVTAARLVARPRPVGDGEDIVL